MNVVFRVDSSYKIGLGRDNGYYCIMSVCVFL